MRTLEPQPATAPRATLDDAQRLGPRDDRPLVSVVMPSLNQAGYVGPAVESVFSQAFGRLELVIADGGSIDGTLSRLNALKTTFGQRLRWVSEPDNGPSNAVNKALRRTQGDIIGWLNADDCYAPNAISHAVGFLAAHPEAIMVYGEGEHIDTVGAFIGRYPTRTPDAGIDAFQSGCFICQPTVFVRRSALEAVGFLDEELATAFDFDLWLRLFKRFPDRIGYIDRVLARSRLHADCITYRQRRLVAAEAVRLLAKYLGYAQDHWLRTHIEELLAAYPDGDVRGGLSEHVAEFVREFEGCLRPEAAQRLWDDLARDSRLQLAMPGVYADVYPDGWAPQILEIRLAEFSYDGNSLRLACEHAWPIEAPLSLTLRADWGWESQVRIGLRGPFALDIPLAAATPKQAATVRITSDTVFVPDQFPGGGDDGRGLAFLVRRMLLR